VEAFFELGRLRQQIPAQASEFAVVSWPAMKITAASLGPELPAETVRQIISAVNLAISVSALIGRWSRQEFAQHSAVSPAAVFPDREEVPPRQP
jgi:hypothetical protein